MKRLTIRLDDRTALRARAKAARRKVSLSQYVREALRQQLRRDDEYEAAYRAWRERKPFPLKGPPPSYPTREEIYDS